MIQPGSIASWAAGWYGSDVVHFDSVERSDYVTMLKGIHTLMNEADVVVGYNSRRFDIPWLQGGFVTVGLPPPAPYKSLDLLAVVRKQFKFPSYKLEYVVKALGIGEKLPHEGFPLWVKCMAGDRKAWETMEEYNIHDVEITQLLYERIFPYLPNTVNHSLLNGLVCPHCGSEHYQSRGTYPTKSMIYRRFQCQDCGKWFRGNKSIAPTEKMLAI